MQLISLDIYSWKEQLQEVALNSLLINYLRPGWFKEMLILVTFLPYASSKNCCTDKLAYLPSAHLSTIDVVEDEVQFVSSLEREVKAHQERVLHILQ